MDAMREVVETADELEAAIEDYEEMNWKVYERTPGRVVFRRGKRGNVFWHLPYLLLAPVVGNLTYSAFRRFNRPRYTVVRVRGGVEEEPPAATGPTVEEIEQVGMAETVADQDGVDDEER